MSQSPLSGCARHRPRRSLTSSKRPCNLAPCSVNTSAPAAMHAAGSCGRERSLVPDGNDARAVLAGRNHSCKTPKREIVIRSHDRQATLTNQNRWSFGDGPRLEYTSDLDPEVVVLSPSEMLLNHKPHMPQNSRKWSQPMICPACSPPASTPHLPPAATWRRPTTWRRRRACGARVR